jgi:RNA polymerase sigma-70 factor (ECF subfamily)
MTASATKRAIESVWKGEAARVIGGLARIVRDVSLAEELAQDALVAALEHWPASGIPDNPGAWLMTTAKNRALNARRREKVSEKAGESLRHEAETHVPLAEFEAALEAHMDLDVRDDVLRLLFTACHPSLSAEARVALTLRMVGGLTTEEIARAFLVTEAAMAQRVVRAKQALGKARVPFELPRADELSPRLASVLEVVYLIFNEGYSATAGEDLMRPALAEEALRLGELLAMLAPSEPETHGLSSLMHLHASRARARTDASGDPVLLTEQDRSLWDSGLMARGLEALARAEQLTDDPHTYQLQASIAACHARAASADETDWTRIAELYGTLARLVPSPVVELNRAVAISRSQGPEAGLALLDALRAEPGLARYHFLPSARADLLERLGRFAEARDEFERAASLAANVRQRDRLRARAAACVQRSGS